jgi:hypothetical protein
MSWLIWRRSPRRRVPENLNTVKLQATTEVRSVTWDIKIPIGKDNLFLSICRVCLIKSELSRFRLIKNQDLNLDDRVITYI